MQLSGRATSTRGCPSICRMISTVLSNCALVRVRRAVKRYRAHFRATLTMTHAGHIAAGDAHRPAASRPSSGATSLIETVKLALPIALTQLGQIAMMTSDLALLGRLGEHVVAAVGAGAHRAVRRLRARHGPRVGGGAARRAGVRRAAAAHGAARACASDYGPRRCSAFPLSAVQLYGEEILIALGQTPDRGGARGATISRASPGAWCRRWWFIALRGFMGAVNRPEPALWITLAAIPANCVLAYALIYGEFGLPRLDLFGAGHRDHDRQYRHVRRRRLGLLRVPAVQEIPGARPLLAHGLAADRPAVRDRRADLGRLPARIRLVRRRRPADGLDSDHRARRASDRASPSPRSCSWCRSASRWRRPCGSATRSARRDAEATRRAGFAAIALGAVLHGGDDAARRRSARDVIPLAVSRNEHTATRRDRCSLPRRCCWSARASSSPTACRPWRPARCAG